MRQPKPATPLHALVAAVPAEALRPLLLALLQNGAAPDAPAKRRGGWPKGKPRKPLAAKRAATAADKPRRGPGRPRKITPKVDPNIARRKRYAELQLARRAAKAKKTAAKAKTGGNGSGTAQQAAGITPTQRFWSHAEMLAPTAPYKAVAREFGSNLALMKDCYRQARLPPGLAPGAVERFLEIVPPHPAPPMVPHP